MKTALLVLFPSLPLAAAPTVQNPQMTDGTEKPDSWTQTWTASGKFEIARDTTTFHSAPASLRLQATGGPAKGQVMQSFAAEPGDTLPLSGYVRADGGSNAVLGIMAYDEKWNGLGFTAIGNAPTGAGWVKVRGTVTLPPATSNAGIVLMTDGPGRVWLDDVSTTGTDPGADAKPVNAPELPAPAKPAGPRKPTSSTDPAEGFYPAYPDAWRKTFNSQRERSKKGNIPILFLGDSLTQAWPEQPAWKPFADKGAVSFGIGGDGTPQILWRLDHGLIDGLNPDLIVLQVGVNNVWPGFSAEDTVKGIEAILDRIKQKAPHAKILLCGNTHFFNKGDGKTRTRVNSINAALSKIAAERGHGFVDFSDQLLTGGDELNLTFYSEDKLHFTPAAYEIWSSAIESALKK